MAISWPRVWQVDSMYLSVPSASPLKAVIDTTGLVQCPVRNGFKGVEGDREGVPPMSAIMPTPQESFS